MFYRRKIILSLLQASGGVLEKIPLQKLLFLFSQKQTKPEYEFIPYKFGCYSYSANADITAMVSKGILCEGTTGYALPDKTDYIKTLKDADRKILNQVQVLYGKMDGNKLMLHTYRNFPYYAINSVAAANMLSDEEMANVEHARPAGTQTILFTIGYEGVSLEKYLNKLLVNDIKVLVDVRRNPLSMKFGFSKNQLLKYCSSLGIEYMHFPELGIHSDQRQELATQADYDKLFIDYKRQLPSTHSSQSKLLELLVKHHRIALTCFEANICQCHRKHLAEAIEILPDFNYTIKHI
ncbi:MAG TPA: DUF488 domain-containing protein [Daejeonella sp.]